MMSVSACRKNFRSDVGSKGIESGSFTTDSLFVLEGADFWDKGMINVGVKENNSLASDSVSPISTSDEDSVHKSDIEEVHLRSHESDESQIKVTLLNDKVSMLRKKFKTVSGNVRELEEENCVLSEEYQSLQSAKWTEDLVMKEKLGSLKEMLEDRNRRVKELWFVIQMLDDENMVLKGRVEEREEMEEQLNRERYGLKISDDDARNIILVSYNTVDWEQKLHQELSSEEPQTYLDCGSMFNGGIRRRRQRDVRKSSHHVLDKKHNNGVCSSKHQVNHQHDTAERNMSVNFGVEKMVDKVPGVEMNRAKVQRFQRKPFMNGCARTDEFVNSRGSKGAIWGSGLWPPQWTTVPNVFQDENCTTWKARD